MSEEKNYGNCSKEIHKMEQETPIPFRVGTECDCHAFNLLFSNE